MFTVERPDVERVLRDYGIPETLRDFSELQRYHYERYDPDSREVRLILRLRLEGRAPLVLRFKNEEDVTQALLESQCRFAQTLRENGIPTPRQYRAESCFTRWSKLRIFSWDRICLAFCSYSHAFSWSMRAKRSSSPGCPSVSIHRSYSLISSTVLLP